MPDDFADTWALEDHRGNCCCDAVLEYPEEDSTWLRACSTVALALALGSIGALAVLVALRLIR
jgi:hypothetical protein